MPDPLPNVFTTPASFSGDVLATCVHHPFKMILAGFCFGLAVEAVVYLTGEAYQALVAYRAAVNPT